ncbi:MAG: efflux RND transporter permease subunit [Hyphomicrobiaceae bacterium]
MLDWLISFGLYKRFLVVVAAACLLMCGTAGVKNNRLGVISDLSPLSLTVKTESLGLSSAEVEFLTTVPLKADLLNGVPWLQVIQSESMARLSTISMIFASGTDLLKAGQIAHERLNRAHPLPNASSPPVMPALTGTTVRIGQVAHAREGHQPLIGDP